MVQAIMKNQNAPNHHSQQGWLLVLLLSFLLHLVIVGWFSSLRPNFPEINQHEFRVGLTSSEGMGDLLKASQAVVQTASDIETETTTPVTEQEQATKISLNQLNEMQDSPPIEVAKVIEPEAAENPTTLKLVHSISSVSESEEILPNKNHSRLVTALPEVETAVDTIQAASESIDIENVATSDDYFKPAEVLGVDDPLKTLPIEELSAVPAPEAIAANLTPESAKYDIDILEVSAKELIFEEKPVIKRTKPLATGDKSLHSAQTVSTRSNINAAQSPDVPKLENKKPEPLVLPKTYILELKAFLNKFKEYPAQAHQLRQQGVVIVSLKIKKNGQIIASDIKRSSGHTLLDQEVTRMISKAAKLPALPDTIQQQSIELLIPIRFKPR